MTTIMFEIERNNVTVSEFLTYVATMCQKKGVERGFSREDFESPAQEQSSSYSVVDGKKLCHFSEKREVTKFRRKHASYEIPNGFGGTFTRYYYTDEIEEYTETELYRYDQEHSAEDAPCKSEIYRTFPYDYQCYGLNWDGTCYNETCEFTFDDDKRGHGYYYFCTKNNVETA